MQWEKGNFFIWYINKNILLSPWSSLFGLTDINYYNAIPSALKHAMSSHSKYQ